jgi:hypothetical protein
MKYQYQYINEEGLIIPYFYKTFEELIKNHPEVTTYFELIDRVYVMKYYYN